MSDTVPEGGNDAPRCPWWYDKARLLLVIITLGSLIIAGRRAHW